VEIAGRGPQVWPTMIASPTKARLDQAFDPLCLDDRTAVADANRFPPGRHPYYILTPRYVRTSAGVRAMHLLCHCLNRVGQEAYVAIAPYWSGPDRTNPGLLTPVLTGAMLARHRAQGLSPIAVYPETVRGNPLGADIIVRYLLNFPGLLLDGFRRSPRDLVFGYSRVLAEAGGVADNVLFIPASDAAIFRPDPVRERRGGCFWAAKYRDVHGGEPLAITEGCVEITRDQPDSPGPAEIAELFRRSEVFYAYENTALALEAALCLCPTVFVPNPWLTEVIASREMGWDGFAFGTDPAEIARAKATVHLMREHYLATYPAFWDQLSRFVAATQARAAEAPGFPRRMTWINRWRTLGTRCRHYGSTARMLVRVAARVLRTEGPGAVWRKARARLVR
jgi:hypothetical protein